MAISQELTAIHGDNVLRPETDKALVGPGMDKVWLPDVSAVAAGKTIEIINPNGTAVLVVNGIGVRVGTIQPFKRVTVTPVSSNPDIWNLLVI